MERDEMGRINGTPLREGYRQNERRASMKKAGMRKDFIDMG